MTDFWDRHPSGNRELLRLLTTSGKWLKWQDKEADLEDAGSKRISGCHEQVEDKLTTALHTTNVVVLLGSGASFCAKDAGVSNAPSMWHLWHSVRDAQGHAAFDQVAKDVMGDVPAEGKENIEGLLSLCKMSLELLKVQAENVPLFTGFPKLVSLEAFIEAAEKVILEKVDFVKPDTDLTAHAALVRKFARRSPEKPRVKLFTTNYDLCIEAAASRLGVVLVDGFSHAAVQRFNRDHFQHDIVRRSSKSTKADYLDGVFHLYKLHGSVDWRRLRDGIVSYAGIWVMA